MPAHAESETAEIAATAKAVGFRIHSPPFPFGMIPFCASGAKTLQNKTPINLYKDGAKKILR